MSGRRRDELALDGATVPPDDRTHMARELIFVSVPDPDGGRLAGLFEFLVARSQATTGPEAA